MAGALYLPFMAVTTVLINDAFARSSYGAVAFAVFGSALSVLPALAVRDLTDLMSAWGGIYAATGLILPRRPRFFSKIAITSAEDLFYGDGILAAWCLEPCFRFRCSRFIFVRQLHCCCDVHNFMGKLHICNG